MYRIRVGKNCRNLIVRIPTEYKNKLGLTKLSMVDCDLTPEGHIVLKPIGIMPPQPVVTSNITRPVYLEDAKNVPDETVIPHRPAVVTPNHMRIITNEARIEARYIMDDIEEQKEKELKNNPTVQPAAQPKAMTADDYKKMGLVFVAGVGWVQPKKV